MLGEFAIIGTQHLVSAALADPVTVGFVFAPIVLLIALLYWLLFVVFPKTDKRVRRAWAICMPVALIILVVTALFPLDRYAFRGLDAVVFAFAVMLFVGPMVLTRRPQERSSWLVDHHPKLALVSIIFPAVLTFVLRVYFPSSGIRRLSHSS